MINRRATHSKRALRTRSHVLRAGGRPRLSVFRSNKYIAAQVIDDTKGVTLAAASGKKPEEVGTAVAQAALKAQVKQVVFDRGAYNYHGQVKLLAEAARAAGLEF